MFLHFRFGTIAFHLQKALLYYSDFQRFHSFSFCFDCPSLPENDFHVD